MGLYGREIDHFYGRILWATLGLKHNVKYFSYSRELVIQSFNRYTEEIYEMAEKMKKTFASKPTKRVEFEWKGFINVSLTVEQKATYQKWDIHDADVWDGLAQYCSAGYKVNLSYNKQNDKFNCTGTGQPSTGANNGYAVSAFANTPYEAARVWLFKVSAVLPDIWTDYNSAELDDIG